MSYSECTVFTVRRVRVCTMQITSSQMLRTSILQYTCTHNDMHTYIIIILKSAARIATAATAIFVGPGAYCTPISYPSSQLYASRHYIIPIRGPASPLTAPRAPYIFANGTAYTYVIILLFSGFFFFFLLLFLVLSFYSFSPATVWPYNVTVVAANLI